MKTGTLRVGIHINLMNIGASLAEPCIITVQTIANITEFAASEHFLALEAQNPDLPISAAGFENKVENSVH